MMIFPAVLLSLSRRLLRGVFFWLLLLCISSFHSISVCHAASTQDEVQGEEGDPADAVLFPFFMLILGIVSYYLQTRYMPWFPYTAIMFIWGTLIGAFAVIHDGDSVLNESVTEYWLGIDSELLLVAFLPGLVYSDAAGLNSHLFRQAFSQCFIFAFPMVLAGTTLTALIPYYIFDNHLGWSFPLCMTFGSILAATDPVAVAALLDAVGAPPRLKTHIAGESLLNDGSAIVFFTIFSELYFFELGIPELGQDINGPEGIALFFQMSVGGACVGVFFGIGLVTLMYVLNRRLEREENVTQVATVFTMAYVCYFVADVAWGTSGVIAVVTMGVLFMAFGSVYINDQELMEDFWSTVEFLLNTVLFSLGGLVWGSIISNEDPDYPSREFTGKDWGYLIVLFILLTVIRFMLFTICFPITKNIGLSTNWKEMAFQSFGGLRGAVGISLAIYLDNLVVKNSTPEDTQYVEQTNKLFGYIGGIAFLSLVINGTLAGPFLNYLGLTKPTDTRETILQAYHTHIRTQMIHLLVVLLEEKRFTKVSASVVRHHVPILRDFTREEFVSCVKDSFNFELKSKKMETAPDNDDTNEDVPLLDYIDGLDDNQRETMALRSSIVTNKTTSMPSLGSMGKNSTSKLVEIRTLFIEILKAQYQNKVESGELTDREFVFMALFESLEWTSEAVCNRNEPLDDWKYVHLIGYPASGVLTRLFNSNKVDTKRQRLDIEKVFIFMDVHEEARRIVRDELKYSSVFQDLIETVLGESEACTAQAKDFLKQYDASEKEVVLSHLFSKILLNCQRNMLEDFVRKGLITEQEAHHQMDEIQESLLKLDHCSLVDHSDGQPSRGPYNADSPIETDMVINT